MSFDEYMEKYEILNRDDYYKAINMAFSIAEDIYNGKEKMDLLYPKKTILGVSIQKALDIVVKEKKEELEKRNARPKRSVIAIMDMYNVMAEYYKVIKNLEKMVFNAEHNAREEICKRNYDQDKEEELCKKHEKICERAKAGKFNSDELQALLNNGEYCFNQEDIQSIMQINYLQREKFYVYCSLLIDTEFSEMQNSTRVNFLNIGWKIDKLKETKGKTSLTSIARGNLGVRSSNSTGKTLYDEFMEGMKYASEHILKGVNNGRNSAFGENSIYDYSHVDSYSFDSDGDYAFNFVVSFINENQYKDVSLQDIESLDKIKEYLNKRAYDIYLMDDIDFLEYKKAQMHLSEEEKEMFEAKVTEFKESERIYNGRGY